MKRDSHSIAVLASTLGNDGEHLNLLIEKLVSASGQNISPFFLTGLVIEGREYLAFQKLCGLGVISGLDSLKSTGQVNTVEKIQWLQEHLQVVIDIFSESTASKNSSPFFELAWTLPDALAYNSDRPSKSLAGLMRYVISTAQKRLFIVSPFLEKQGVEILRDSLHGAAMRGVQIYVVSHGLDQTGSSGYNALNFIQSIIPNVQAYSSPMPGAGSPYLLIHAKIIVADGQNAVISSANLTQYGLGTHLEIGLGLSEEFAQELDKLAFSIIRSDMVKQIL